MIFKIFFISLTSLLVPLTAFTQSDLEPIERIDFEQIELFSPDTLPQIIENPAPFKYRESKRFMAALLCLTLGPFGMHRLYLGTSPKVAAAYSVTLGGIGIVPTVDLLLITFSKDISRFRNNERVIMWMK